METTNKEHYPSSMIELLEEVWGEGFLSPGGPEEVSRIIGKSKISDTKLLDIGCGTGGLDIELVKTHNVAHVTGIDIEEGVISHAMNLINKNGLNDRINLIKVKPGLLPFSAGEFDVVFSCGTFIHIENKHEIMSEVFRVLKPGGQLLALDWLVSTEALSPAMADYIAAEGLGFHMSTPALYRDALEKAGFSDIQITSRNLWYRQQARKELAHLITIAKKETEKFNKEFIDYQISVWKRMISVLDTGEHCPSHLHALKPE